MVNYQDGKIYKLCSNVDDKIYVGSTCSTLKKRKAQHVSARKHLNGRVYEHFNLIGWANVQIIELEWVICLNRTQLRAHERRWYDKLKPELNMNRPKDNCPHGYKESTCVECDGPNICEHRRVRYNCAPCKGGGRCDHGNSKYRCVLCASMHPREKCDKHHRLFAIALLKFINS
jgi:hypothetical protein